MSLFSLYVYVWLLSNSISSPINTLPTLSSFFNPISPSLSLLHFLPHTQFVSIIYYRKPISQITLIDPNFLSLSPYLLKFSFGSSFNLKDTFFIISSSFSIEIVTTHVSIHLKMQENEGNYIF
jgi:hypothetical protein